MANITNALALKFSDQQVRQAADLMSQSYNRGVQVSARWTALGSNQSALDQMQVDIRGAADKLLAAFSFLCMAEKVWFGSSGISAMFPNDTSPVFDNGGTAQDPNRPALTGAKVNNVITRLIEFQNWLLSPAGAFNGTLQVETATAVGTISTAGNATIVVTAFGMTNSPKTVSVAVASADTATAWATKVRTALAADPDVGAFFTISGAAAAIILTSKAAKANDQAVNCSLANGTCTGITAAPTSANTTAGVDPRGGVSWLNTVVQCSSYGPTPIVLADAQNFLTRCSELLANYQASSNVNLNTILAAAVNPNNL
jgi:hypothetical protein